MSEYDLLRASIQLIHNDDSGDIVIRKGSDSSLKRFTSYISKLKLLVQADQDTTILVEEFSGINFEKYLDEVIRCLVCDTCPKKPTTILSILRLLVLFERVYTGFLRMYHNFWQEHTFVPFIGLFKDRIGSDDLVSVRHILRFLIESSIIGLVPFQHNLDTVIEIILKTEMASNSCYSIALYMIKTMSRIDLGVVCCTSRYLSSVDVLKTSFSKRLYSALKREHMEMVSMGDRNRVLFESKGDVSFHQSKEYLQKLDDFKQLSTAYKECCEICHMTYNESDWIVDDPIVENGRIVFVDRSVDDEDFAVAFGSKAEFDFYTDLSLPSTTLSPAVENLDSWESVISSVHENFQADALAMSVIRNHLDSVVDPKDLVMPLLDLARFRIDQIPFIARFFALIKDHLPSICNLVSKTAFDQCYFLIHRKLQMIGMRSRVAILCGELTKFGILSSSDVFSLLFKAARDLDKYNIDLVVQLLENCGRFLYRRPSTRKRTEHLLRVLNFNGQRLLPSESSSIRSVICHILDVEEECHLAELDPLESLYLPRLLVSSENQPALDELCALTSLLGAPYIAQSLFNSRVLTFVDIESVVGYLKMMSPEGDVAIFLDVFIECCCVEISCFPFVDKQLVGKSIEVLVTAAAHGIISHDELEDALTYWFRRRPSSSSSGLQRTEWDGIVSWASEICGSSFPGHEHGTDSLQIHTEPEKTLFVAQDSVDARLDEIVSNCCASAIEERRVSSKGKEDAFICVGSPRKTEGLGKIVLVRRKGRKPQHDFREIG